jgi:hypothetical protein
MILGKLWKAIAAQFNKLVNAIRGYDPIAEMQYEYDRSVDQIREGREGLAQYRALVERVTRQVNDQIKRVSVLEAKIKAYLNAGDRDSAGRIALELKRAKEDQAENEKQLAIHEQAFGQAEQMIQDQIDKNRARVRVAADMSGEGIEEIQREVAVEKSMADDALREFEISQGLATPETTKAAQSTKELGPAMKTVAPLPEI